MLDLKARTRKNRNEGAAKWIPKKSGKRGVQLTVRGSKGDPGNYRVKGTCFQCVTQGSHRQIRRNYQQIQIRIGWNEIIAWVNAEIVGGYKTVDKNFEWTEPCQEWITWYLRNCQIKETIR